MQLHNGPVTGDPMSGNSMSGARQWTVIVPVKDTRRGKSRLALPEVDRRSIVTAMAVDTVTAAAAQAAVLVVAETERDIAEFGRVAGVHCHLTRKSGLNEAIADGLAAIDRRAGAVAVLPADLPGLLPADLAVALRLSEHLATGVVADHDGTGTTLLTAHRPVLLRPHFGPDSFRRHLTDGAQPIEVPATSTLRFDVDIPADLAGALGPRTRAALAAAGVRAEPRAC